MEANGHDVGAADAARAITAEASVFAVLPSRRRTWAVGSVHGNVSVLRALHGKLRPRLTPADNLVYLGNLIGHGGDAIATVDEILLFRRTVMATHIIDQPGVIAYLRGRQEEIWQKLLQIQIAPNPREVLEWMVRQGIAATVGAYGGSIDEGRRAAAMGSAALSQWTNRLRAAMRSHDGHERLMSALRRAAYAEDGTLLFVSAGIDVSRPLSEQSDSFWWGGRDFEDMEGAYGDFGRVVRGFDIRNRGVWTKPWAVSLDGGCGFGGILVAACFETDGRQSDTIEAG